MAKVDIIVPAYNAGRYLPAAINSVAAQKFNDWRILLVDDGSTDNTEELVRPFVDQLGEKLYYLRQDNKGLPAARNTAIRNSSAELLALLDADDVWLPSRLSESIPVFEGRPEIGLSYALVSRIDSEGTVYEEVAGHGYNPSGRIATDVYTRSVDLPCPTITFRRKAVHEVGLFDESLRATEDRDMWLRIALHYQVAFIPKVLAQYRSSPSSMSGDPNRMRVAQLQFIAKHFGANGCGRIPRRKALARTYKQYADGLLGRSERWNALSSSIRAATIYPFDTENLRSVASIALKCLTANAKTF